MPVLWAGMSPAKRAGKKPVMQTAGRRYSGGGMPVLRAAGCRPTWRGYYMRLFIALNFSPEVRLGLRALRDELRSLSSRGNFTTDDNLHLTLAFLGECGAMQADRAIEALDAADFEPLDIWIERVGRFRRDGGGGDIWWAGVRDNKLLSSVQGALTDRLSSAGFALDKRRYSPHITLGREVIAKAAPWSIEPFGETVRKIDLMKSERINGKLSYSSIYAVEK